MKMKFTKLVLMAFGILLLGFSTTAQDLECIITLPSGTISIPVGAPAAGFGGEMDGGETITGVAVVVEADPDGGFVDDDTPEMGCDTILNGAAVMGNVAFIQRGACFFSDKVYRAQVAGAISAIICNHTPGEGVIGMGSGGDFAGQAEIPSGFLSFEDCALITAALENGDEVTITLRKPNLFNGTSAYAKQTPISQLLPLDSIEVSYANASDTIIANALFTVDITDPNGDLTTLTSGGEIAAASSVVASFEAYEGTMMGRYDVVFSNSVTSDSIFDYFEYTEYTWALDDDSFSNFASTSDADFVANGYRYDMGSYYLTGPEGANVTYAAFAMANAADVTAPGNNFFTIIVYGVGDDVLVNGATTYDDFELLTFGIIEIDGSETQDQLLYAELDNVVSLGPIEDVLVVVNYEGSSSGTGISPRYTTGGSTDYPVLGTTVFTNQLFLGGFVGSPSGTIRLYEEGFIPPVDATTNTYLNKGEVELSPNPVTSALVVDFDLVEQADKVEVSIINLQGQTVMREAFENVSKANYTIDVDHLPNGSYVLLTSTPEGRAANQFIVTK